MQQIKAIAYKEYLEHKAAFLYVPGILITLMLIASITAIYRAGGQIALDSDVAEMRQHVKDGFDLFNLIYAGTLLTWTGYLVLMLYFYFAGSFAADSKNNAMLFWKSMPISDLKILGIKTLAGLTIFPVMIAIWSLIAAVAGFLVLSLADATSPIIDQINTGTSFLTFINVELSGFVFILTTLLWLLPLFAYVGLLGSLVGAWAIPAAILSVAVISALENIVSLGNGGFLSDAIVRHIEGPVQTLGRVFPDNNQFEPDSIAELVSVARFVPAYLSEIDWTAMVVGWVIAGVFIYIASEYRRRRLAA